MTSNVNKRLDRLEKKVKKIEISVNREPMLPASFWNQKITINLKPYIIEKLRAI